MKDNNWFYKDLSTGFEFFVPFDQFYVYRMGGFNLSRGYILEIHSFFCHGRNRMVRSVYCKRQNCRIKGGRGVQ